MAKAVFVFAALFLFVVLLQLDPYSGQWAVGVEAIECGSKCGYRCSESSRHNLCIRACNTCCQRCNCVPPGTSGNHNVCPCYASLKTHGGRPKCP